MILPGAAVIRRGLVRNLPSAKLQQQPCGVDLTLRRVLEWTTAATVDLDNSKRVTAQVKEKPFEHQKMDRQQSSDSGSDSPTQPLESDHPIFLPQGSYLIEFNETVTTPLDTAAQIFVRSSLFRSGVCFTAGLMDSGYEGAVGGLLQVVNKHGLKLYPNAKLAQIVFHEMKEPVKGYDGVYQGRKSV